MRHSSAVDAVQRLLLYRGVPLAYVSRLVGELADHREDLVRELLDEGATPKSAEEQADRRLGNPLVVVEEAIDRLRARSFVGRHPILSLIVLPLFSLPVIWVALLLLAIALTGGFSPTHRPGTFTPGQRALLLVVCWICNYVVPVACAAAFYLLARRRLCGGVWAWAACLVLAGVFSFTFVKFSAGPVGRSAVLVAAVPIPNALRLIPPLVVAVLLEWNHRLRANRLANAAAAA